MKKKILNRLGTNYIFFDIQTQKVCYLPFSAFLLKPTQRLSHYKLLLQSK